MDVEQALRKLGIRGRWQVLHLTIIGVAGSASACFHMLAIIFIGKRLPTLGLRLELVLSRPITTTTTTTTTNFRRRQQR